MNALVLVLLLAIAIALGIALAPYVLPVIGWIIVVVLVLWIISQIFYHGFNALNVIATQIRSTFAYHKDLSTTAFRMVFAYRLPTETSSFRRRVHGLTILAIYVTLGAIILPVVLLLLMSSMKLM